VYAAITLEFGAAGAIRAQTPPVQPEDQASQIEEVVVTARRVEEKAQDVPISITVFNQKELDQHNITQASSLATFTPSLSTNTEFGDEGASFAIRGFRQEIDTTASVAVYFADVVAPRGGAAGTNAGDGAGPGNFFDLQNVQVLKGPQGTLFGRNTDGGAILLVPRKPTSELGGFVDAGYGNYDMLHVTAVGNVPISDNFRVRVGMDHQNRDGWMKNISGIGPDAFNDINYTAARVSAVWNITPDIENYTIASFVTSDHNGVAEKMIGCDPASTQALLDGCQQFNRDVTQDFYTTENDSKIAEAKMQQWQVINTTTWTVSDNLTAKNIASYASLTNTVYSDLFSTNFHLPPTATFPGFGTIPNPFAGTPLILTTNNAAPGHKTSDMADITEELQLQGNALSNRWTWQAGLYTEFNEPQSATGVTSATTINCTDSLKLQCFDALGALIGQQGAIGTVNYQVGRIRYHSYGIYEQSTYALTDKLKLTEGLRYTMDSAEAHYDEALYHFPSANTPVLYCIDTTSQYNFALSLGMNPVPGNNPDLCPVSLKKNSYAPTWLIGLDYKATDDILVYGKYSRGYRQGSVSPTGPQGARTFNPEKVEAFEVGTKTSFDGMVHGVFNVAAFYNNFRDQQIGQTFLCSHPCAANPNLGIVNAGHSRIWGTEVESTISPYRDVTFALSYTYLNAKVVSISSPPLPVGSPYDITSPTISAGSELPLSPKNKYSATLSYVLPVPSNVGTVSVAANYAYQSGMIQADPSRTPFYKTGAFGLTNLNLDWTAVAGSPFDVGLFATNVFNQHYFLVVPGIFQGYGFEPAVLGEPAMYGGHIRFNFGA
jgi:iron complex outermembrane receptor protein